MLKKFSRQKTQEIERTYKKKLKTIKKKWLHEHMYHNYLKKVNGLNVLTKINRLAE